MKKLSAENNAVAPSSQFDAAAQIEESTVAGIRHKHSELQGRKIALLAAVTGLVATSLGIFFFAGCCYTDIGRKRNFLLGDQS